MADVLRFTARRRMLRAGLAAAIAAPVPSWAQAYPSRPVRLIVPFPPGGTTDIVARAFVELLGRELGQQIVVDYKPGAVTNIGTEQAMRATPDGYTLLFGSSVLATNFATGPVPPFDPQKALAPISMVNTMAYVVCANPAAPFSPQRPGGGAINPARTAMALRGEWQTEFIDGLHIEALYQKSGDTWVAVRWHIGATDVWYAWDALCADHAAVTPEVCR